MPHLSLNILVVAILTLPCLASGAQDPTAAPLDGYGDWCESRADCLRGLKCYNNICLPQAEIDTHRKAAAAAAVRAAAAEKERDAQRGPPVIVRGKLEVAMATSMFGPGTTVDRQGNLVSRATSILMIEYLGRRLTVETNRDTKVDESLKSGALDPNATYRVRGRIQENTIVATEISKEK